MSQTKPTTEEYLDRIELARTLLVRRLPKHTIRKLIREQVGWDLSHQAIDGYLSRAREQITLDLDAIRGSARCESKAFYESVIADTKASCRDRLKAQERLDALLGLEAPQRHLHGGDPENRTPIPVLGLVCEGADGEPEPGVNGHCNGHAAV